MLNILYKTGVALWLGLVAAPASWSADVPTYGGEIRVAINSDILSTNPGVLRDGNTDTVLYHVAEALVAYKDDLTVGPMLASRIDISDDHKTYTFTLREGLVFHNGASVTATEVKWSWERMMAPETGFRCSEFYDGRGATGLRVEKITVLDPLHVQFQLNKPSSLFLHRMANIQCLTAILHPESVAPDGEWNKPIGTGPYKIGEWQRGRSITLDRFDDYVARSGPRNGLTGKKVAYADQIVFHVTPDRIAAKSSVYAGNIDVLFAMPLSAYREVERRRKQKGDIKIYHHDTLDWTVLLMQSDDPLLSDVRMRKAVAYAVSPELVTTFSTFDLARPNSSATATLSPFHTPFHDKWYDYDPDKARRLAREAGYDGQVLRIQTNRKFSYMFDNAVAIQAMLNAAGFKAKIEVFDWATQLTNYFSGDFQLSSFGYSARSHPALMYGNFTGSKDLRASYQWDDPAAIQMLQSFDSVFSDVAAQKILDNLHQAMMEQVPLIGLYNDHIIDISKNDIHGYEPWAFGRPRLWGVWKSLGSEKE